MQKVLRYVIATLLSIALAITALPIPQAQAAAQKRPYIVTVHHRSDIDEVVAASRSLGAKRFNIFRYALGGFACCCAQKRHPTGSTWCAVSA